jgi:retinol dehydrogenase-12
MFSIILSQVLLSRNAKVYMACRSRARAEEALIELKTLYPQNTPIFIQLDLADLQSVRRAADEFLRYHYTISYHLR